MDKVSSNRRKSLRRDYRVTIRFTPAASRGVSLRRGMSENISNYGIALLSRNVVERGKVMELYLPVDKNIVIPVWAKAVWSEVEEGDKDSPYWVRTGLEFSFQEREHQELFEKTLYEEKIDKHPAHARVSFL